MARQGINTGITPNDGFGDSLLTGAIKINANFTEIYNTFGNGTNLISYTSTSGIATYASTAGVASIAQGLTGTPNLNAGVVTATSFFGSGSGLTGLTGAVANTYGNGTAVPQIVVDSNGRITSITNVAISTGGVGGGGTSGIYINDGTLVGFAGTIDFGIGISVTPLSSGIVTANVVYAPISGYSTYSGISTYATVAGYSTSSGIATVSGYSTSSGIATVAGYASTAGIATVSGYSTSSGIATVAGYASTAGIATVAQGLIGTPNLNVGVVTATLFSGPGAMQSRTIVNGITTAIANNGIGNTNITGFKSYALMKVGLSTAGWLRLYTDSASRIADASRSIGIDPSPGSGVIAEVITTGILTTQIITPFVMGGNFNNPVDATIYAAITNLSGVTTSISVNLTILQLEV